METGIIRASQFQTLPSSHHILGLRLAIQCGLFTSL